MKNKVLICVTSVLIIIALLATVVFINEYNNQRDDKLQIKNEYIGNYNQLNSAVNNITFLLNKARHNEDIIMTGTLAAQLYSEAELAKNAVVKLHLTNTPNTLNRFLLQVENCALSLSQSFIRGEPISKGQSEALEILSNAAVGVYDAVSHFDLEYDDNQNLADELEEKLNNIENSEVSNGLSSLEESLTDYPEIISKGPYSEAVTNGNPVFLSDKPEITEAQALKKAEELFGVEAQTLNSSIVEQQKISVYRFTDGNINIALSKKGGHPVFMSKERKIEEENITVQKAILKAKDFLEKTEYKSMRETYFYKENGMLIINFAYVDGQTICYPDLIKVGLALDNGETMFFDATGYIFNHLERAFHIPSYTKEEARQRLNSELEVKKVSVVLILSKNGTEIRCYEFLCSGDNNKEMLVFINLNTLKEEGIFILLNSDGGTLVK